MLKLLTYILGQGVATARRKFPDLDEAANGLPALTAEPCAGSGCDACAQVCPTDAITVLGAPADAAVVLDLGACIACGLCVDTCPSGTITRNLSTKTAAGRRQDLVLTNKPLAEESPPATQSPPAIFRNSLAVRVVSTGCSACDLEIGAAGNPVFDMERFGVSVVASPRAADALLVTGPVGKGMGKALERCYQAMSEPRTVIAAGTCAISGGVHRGGYAEANGADSVLPVDVYIPGCPPHPWSIIHGLSLAMGNPGAQDG